MSHTPLTWQDIAVQDSNGFEVAYLVTSYFRVNGNCVLYPSSLNTNVGWTGLYILSASSFAVGGVLDGFQLHLQEGDYITLTDPGQPPQCILIQKILSSNDFFHAGAYGSTTAPHDCYLPNGFAGHGPWSSGDTIGYDEISLGTIPSNSTATGTLQQTCDDCFSQAPPPPYVPCSNPNAASAWNSGVMFTTTDETTVGANDGTISGDFGGAGATA